MKAESQSDLEVKVGRAQELLSKCREEFSRAVVGQEAMFEGLMMGLLAGGHVLLEGVPGLAKTLAVKTLAGILDASFKRIQFTPDLLPADLTGTMVYRQQTGEFVVRRGPVFSNIVLADEINRAPAKVQSALLEAMQERQVTIGDTSYALPDPFFVLATQNPIEQEGTYPLPEAQLDRFLLKILIGYPSPQEELEILRRKGIEEDVKVKQVLFKADLKRLQEVAQSVLVDPRIEEYIVSIVAATRQRSKSRTSYARFIEFGASPRATIALYRCAKIKALLDGRGFVIPEDVKDVAYPVLRHRVVLSYEAEAEDMDAERVIEALLEQVPVP
ncbi:ATPase associated with various cellular activities AAA_3 [Spirochaeta thermophila DSM 6578]|uniref:ATPase associated with various cellular activities AAA_3 n=1 Tax=Winmispira thermophila (strain ATCC 700085 / DSM 6578 / Z-1203) TaxID=869211 RepID=G0GBZ0_WINT7|nr:MoxR family ATPase [Spirochaeta thermophila]AEJ62001.1 ATPase associated with various cellular activities AAA_3 [Spirochaeta thermophila DSM 6578]